MSVSRSREIIREDGVSTLFKRAFLKAYGKAISKPWKYIDPIDQRLGVSLYGNPAGFRNNLGGRIAEFKCRMRSDSNLVTPSDETNYAKQASSFRQQGYLDLGSPYDPEPITQIQEKFDQLINDPSKRVVNHINDPENQEAYRINVENVP
jgi:hypothetical protein